MTPAVATGQISTSVLPAVAALLPILGALLVAPASRVSERLRNTLLVLVSTTVAAISLAFILAVLRGEFVDIQLFRLTPQIWFHLRVDAVGTLYGATVAVMWVIALIYSFGYMAGKPRQNRYFGFFMLSLSWTVGVAYAGNLLTFLIFYELFSVLTYPLVVQEGTPAAMAAGMKYLIYVLIGGNLVLIGVVFTFFLASEQTFVDGGFLTAAMDPTYLKIVFWTFMVGLGVKAALVPLHGWVPDAHPAAPAPFSATLSGVMVAGGTFGIIRVLYQVFGVELLAQLNVMPSLASVAVITVVFAAVLAVGQDDLKRRLAYSTISQMGYVALGVALLGQGAVVGALAHISNHAFMKAALFFAAGILIKRFKIRNVSDMAGIAKRAPVTMSVFALASLGMIGTPPLAGFVSKWYLGTGMLAVEEPLYLLVLLGGALLAAVYLLPVVYVAFFKELPSEAEASGDVHGTDTRGAAAHSPDGTREAPVGMLAPITVCGIAVVLLGLAANVSGLPVSLARVAAEAFFR